LERSLLSIKKESLLSHSDKVPDFAGGWTMTTTLIVLTSIWAVITILFVILLLYRQSLTKDEKDWIPLTDDAKEDSAIRAQALAEVQTGKLTFPIRILGWLSVLMLLVILGVWLYHALTTSPPVQ
jgi:hypothetical protein